MIGKFSQRAAMAVAFTGVAAGALALQPPNPNNAQSVLQWTEREKISAVTTDPSGSWQPLGADTGFLMMGGILAPRDASGVAKVGVRLEHFAPNPAGALSEAMLFDANCTQNTIKLTMVAGYRQRNLSGLVGQEAVNEAAEPIAGHPLAETVQQACAGARSAAAGATVAAAAPSINYQDRPAVMAWAQRNVQASTLGATWTEAGTLPPGILYRSIDSQNSESRTNRRVRVRLELFDPINLDGMSVVSQLTDYDLNCLRNEARRVQVTVFAAHNLSGQSRVTINTPDAYQAADQVPIINSMARDICQDVDRAPRF